MQNNDDANNDDALNKKTNHALAILGGMVEAANIGPPDNLEPEKKGAYACLGLGIIGVIILGKTTAPWYSVLAVATLTLAVALLMVLKRKK